MSDHRVVQRVSYLARRHPRFTRAEWIPVWRAHWDLAASLPASDALSRYLQCEVLFDTDPQARDGFGIAEYASAEARGQNRGDEEYFRIMRADERRVFDRPVAQSSFLSDHHVLAGAGAGPFKVVRFLRRRPSVSPEGFARAWLDDYGPRVLSAHGPLLGYAQDHPLPPDRPGGWGLAVDGTEEFWFPDPDAARRFLESDELSRVSADAALFDVLAAVVTDEVVLREEA